MQDRYRQLDEILLRRTAGPYIGSIASISALSHDVRFTPDSDRRAVMLPSPKGARNGREQLQQRSPLFDYVVGAA